MSIVSFSDKFGRISLFKNCLLQWNHVSNIEKTRTHTQNTNKRDLLGTVIAVEGFLAKIKKYQNKKQKTPPPHTNKKKKKKKKKVRRLSSEND